MTYIRFLFVYFVSVLIYAFTHGLRVFDEGNKGGRDILPVKEIAQFYVDLSMTIYPDYGNTLISIANTDASKLLYWFIIPPAIVYLTYYFFKLMFSWIGLTLKLIATELDKNLEKRN